MMGTWNLGKKFSLFLILIALIGGSIKIFILSQHLNYQAEQAIKERAEILLTTTQAARNYTQKNIKPLLDISFDPDEKFVRESIPNFAARSIFEDFRQQEPDFQDFFYKEAAINPTNLEDKTDSFETEIFHQLQEQFKENNPEKLSGYRTLNGEKLFYLARPLVMKDAQCLYCHGNPSQAPRHLVEMYGDQNGFGWELNSVVAAQMLYVPADRILEQGRQNLLTVTTTLMSILGAVFLAVNLLLWRTVIQPLKFLTRTAKQISSCSVNQRRAIHLRNQLEHQGLDRLALRQDEPGQLARSFEYMLHVLNQREQDLQQAVRERTHSLEQEMRDRQTAQDALQTYSHAINHDLRNLVMGISNLLRVIQLRATQTQNLPQAQNSAQAADQAAAPDGSSAPLLVDSKALNMIEKSCDRQLSLMDSLMDVQSSDIWRIALHPESVDLYRLLEEIRIAYEPKVLAASSTLRSYVSPSLPAIQADPNQIQRVFENLLGNALKYNPDGVEITLSAKICPKNPHSIRCTVSDNGIGIPPEKGQELFKIYARGHDIQRDSGYGLGLYICRKIVEAHGGEIGLAVPSGGTGAEFWFKLPQCTSEEA